MAFSGLEYNGQDHFQQNIWLTTRQQILKQCEKDISIQRHPCFFLWYRKWLKTHTHTYTNDKRKKRLNQARANEIHIQTGSILFTLFLYNRMYIRGLPIVKPSNFVVVGLLVYVTCEFKLRCYDYWCEIVEMLATMGINCIKQSLRGEIVWMENVFSELLLNITILKLNTHSICFSEELWFFVSSLNQFLFYLKHSLCFV